MSADLANLLFFYLLLLVKQNMSSVLPEFVNKIVNKVTTNTPAQPAQNMAPPPTNSKGNAITQPSGTINNLNMSNLGANNLNVALNSNTVNNTRKINSSRNISTARNTSTAQDVPSVRKTYIPSQNSKSDVADNLTNAEKMRELIDSVIISDLDVDKRNRILNVIKTALTSTQAQENRDFDKFSQRYDAMHQPQNMYYPGPGYMQPTQNMYYPGPSYMQPPQNMYYPGPAYMQPPQNMYYPQQQQQQQPALQYDMLFNKMNMIQMEMADLTRHLRDYTRRYMDNMRESDMDQIKNYIEELMKVQDSVNQVAETMPSQEEPVEDKSSLMDKATTSLKSGLSTVTNTVNSIGSKLGLSEEPPAAPVEETVAEPVTEPTEEVLPTELEDEDLDNLPAPENNMMSVDDYAKQANTPAQPEQQPSTPEQQPSTPEQQPSTPEQQVSQLQNNTKRNINKKNNRQTAPSTKPAELSNAIKELNKQNQASAPAQQQGGGKKTKKELSILEQFEKMLSMKRQTKKLKK